MTVSYHNRQLQASAAVETGTTNGVPFQFRLGAVRFVTVPSGATVRTADDSYIGQTPLVASDLTPQRMQFNLSLAGYKPVSVTLDISTDQTNSFSTNLVSVNYLSAMQRARAYWAVSNYAATAQAALAALNAKPNDPDALALQSEATKHLNAERERLDRLARPRRAFNDLCDNHQDADLFIEHEINTSKPAKAVAEAIIHALKGGLGAFESEQHDSPMAENYEIVARQTFSLGILGGTERDALIVVGQAKDDETQIWFKVLEFQIQHSVAINSLTNFKDNKRLVAVSPSRMKMNGVFEEQVRLGVQIVTERIQRGVDEASSVNQ